MNFLKMSGFALSVLLITAGAASAENLSPSERAALAERPATGAEQAIRFSECFLNFVTVDDTPHVLTSDVSGPLVRLGMLRGLKAANLIRPSRTAQRYDVDAYPYLPNGGLAVFDYCDGMRTYSLEPLRSFPVLVSVLTLRLRANLDIETDYPNTSRAIRDNDQILTIPGQTYVYLEKTQDFDPAIWIETQGSRIPGLAPGTVAIGLHDNTVILVPVTGVPAS